MKMKMQEEEKQQMAKRKSNARTSARLKGRGAVQNKAMRAKQRTGC